MIIYPPQLKAVGGARTGIAPANLLDVQDVNGNLYYWADRAINAPVAITGAIPAYAEPPIAAPAGQAVAWCFPTTMVANGGSAPNSASAGNTSQMALNGQVNASIHCGVASGFSTGATLTWSGFSAANIPAGAVIQKVYAVAIIDGSALDTVPLGGNAGFDFPSTAPYAFDSQEFFSPGGDFTPLTVAGIEAATIELQMWASADTVTPNDTATISFVGLAVYYSVGGGGAPGWGFPGENAYGAGPYVPWLVQVPEFKFHRSLVTDVGSFVLQNLSGDTLSRDFEKIARRSTLEGAFFVYRSWQGDAQAAWLEVHGTLSVGEVGVDTVQLKASQLLNPSQDDTPLEIYSETCQLQWGGPRCGSTESTECGYSYQTCQSPTRIMVAMNDYEKNYGEAAANTALNVINRRRTI